jgi:hypothetical protein
MGACFFTTATSISDFLPNGLFSTPLLTPNLDTFITAHLLSSGFLAGAAALMIQPNSELPLLMSNRRAVEIRVKF